MTVIDSRSKSPWLSIWRSPRATFHELLATQRILPPLVLSAAAGTAQAFGRGAVHNIGIRAPLWMILLIVPLGGSVIGVVQMFLASALLFWTSRLVKAPGTFRAIQVIVGWASTPWLISLLLWLSSSLIVGRHLFVVDPTSIQYSSLARELMAGLGLFLVSLGSVLSWIWSLCLLVGGLTVVNNYSIGLAILHLIVALMIVAAVAMLFVVPFMMVAQG